MEDWTAVLTMLASWKGLKMAECILLKAIPLIAARNGAILWDTLRFWDMVSHINHNHTQLVAFFNPIIKMPHNRRHLYPELN